MTLHSIANIARSFKIIQNYTIELGMSK